MNSSTNISLSKCKDDIEIVAFGLKSFRESKSDEVERLLAKGVRIKIITVKPESEILEFVDK